MAKSRVHKIERDEKAITDLLMNNKQTFKELERWRGVIERDISGSKLMEHAEYKHEDSFRGKRARAQLVIYTFGHKIFGEDLPYSSFHQIRPQKEFIFKMGRKKRG